MHTYHVCVNKQLVGVFKLIVGVSLRNSQMIGTIICTCIHMYVCMHGLIRREEGGGGGLGG